MTTPSALVTAWTIVHVHLSLAIRSWHKVGHVPGMPHSFYKISLDFFKVMLDSYPVYKASVHFLSLYVN